VWWTDQYSSRHDLGKTKPRRLPGYAFGLAGLLLLLYSAVPGVTAANAGLLEEKRGALAAADARILDTETQIQQATEEHALRQAEVAELRRQIESARAAELQTMLELEDSRVALSERLVALYKENHASFPVVLQIMASEDALQDVVKLAPQLIRIAQDDKELIERVAALAMGLALQQKELAREQQRLEHLIRLLDEAKLRLVAPLEEAQAARAVLASEVELLESMHALEVKAESHRAHWRGRVSSSTWRLAQGFTFPVDGSYSFINDWGFPRDGGERSHRGTDVMAPFGTPLVACVAGVVDSIDHDQTLGGVVLWLRGDNGHRYYYAHLQSIAPGIRGGMRVLPGMLIGRVGNSGNAAGGAPHLHFQIHPGGGGPVNPFPVLNISG